MNNYGVPDGTYLKSFSPENTAIIHYSSAKRFHYSSFIKGLLYFATAPFCGLFPAPDSGKGRGQDQVPCVCGIAAEQDLFDGAKREGLVSPLGS